MRYIAPAEIPVAALFNVFGAITIAAGPQCYGASPFALVFTSSRCELKAEITSVA
jgi:hypothetical protein